MMPLKPGIVSVAAFLAVMVGAGGMAPLRAFREDTEADLVSRIQAEHEMVKKAKLEIRLGHLKLMRAGDACQKDDHEACHKFLDAYLELIRSSWKDLQSSGRNAVKQPSGFRDLDIALREDAQTLEDLKRRMPFEDRGALDPVIEEADKIHDQVFGALFPSGVQRPKQQKPVPPAQPHGGAGRV
jgi:hypothetical protein